MKQQKYEYICRKNKTQLWIFHLNSFPRSALYSLVREFIWSQVARWYCAFVLLAGRPIPDRLHPFQLRVLPFVQLDVFHFRDLHADAAMHGGAASTQKYSDVVRGPFDLKKKAQEGHFITLIPSK